jgi:hypothetical protein
MLGSAILIAAITLGFQTDKAEKPSEYPPPGDYQHSFEISEKYDKFRDTTTLKLAWGKVWGDRSNELELEVTQLFRGSDRTGRVGLPSFRFVNDGRDSWRYLTHHPIIFLVDEERMSFDPKYDGSVGDGYVLEFLWVRPSKDQIMKLLSAKRVQVRVGIDQFDLMDSHLDSLKEFCSYIAAPSLRLSTSEMKKRLSEARELENQGRDDDARVSYRQIVELAKGSYEENEAVRGIARLDDPARKEAYRKSMEANAKTKVAEKQDKEAKALNSKIERLLKLGIRREERNPKASVSYYKEILKIASDHSVESPDVDAARSRMKALSASK